MRTVDDYNDGVDTLIGRLRQVIVQHFPMVKLEVVDRRKTDVVIRMTAYRFFVYNMLVWYDKKTGEVFYSRTN